MGQKREVVVTRSGGRVGLLLIIGIVCAAVFLIALWGQVTRLNRTRISAGEPVNCIKMTSLFWLIPLGEEEIRGLQGATIGDCEDGGGRVELLTAQGNIPLTWSYDGTPWGLPLVDNDANRINAFVSGDMDTLELNITEGEVNAIVMLIVLLFLIALVSREKLWAWLRFVYESRRPSP